MKRRYHHYSSSVRPLTGPSSLEDAIAAEENTVVRHEFEIDESANAQPTDTPDFDNVSSNRLFFWHISTKSSKTRLGFCLDWTQGGGM